MGIQVEFNPDLALRAYGTEGRFKDECLPKEIIPTEIYEFLKEGQRIYYLKGEIPLVKTKGEQKLSKPLASIIILESTHFIGDGKIWTKGLYKVVKKIEEGEIYFNRCNPIK